MAITDYFKETKAEMKHVTWPTRRQTITFTALVLVISLFVALYVGFFDSVFAQFITNFLPH